MKYTCYFACLLTILALGSAADKTDKEINKQLSQDESQNGEVTETLEKGARNFYGGTLTSWTDFPYTAVVMHNIWLRSAGAVIDELHVLTSKDGLEDVKQSELSVYIGNVARNVVKVSYPTYDGIGTLAVLKLNEKLDLTGENIASIPLQDKELPVGTNCTVSGPDVTALPTPPNQYIRFRDVPIAENDVCKEDWSSIFGEQHLCTGVYASNFCGPDPGSPLVCNGVLTGIATNKTLCDQNIGGLYGNVLFHKKWIEEQMKDSASLNTLSRHLFASLLISSFISWFFRFHS